MKHRLVEYLVCPICAGELDLRAGAMEGAAIMNGSLDNSWRGTGVAAAVPA